MLDMLNGNMKLLTEFVMLFKLQNVFYSTMYLLITHVFDNVVKTFCFS